MAHSYDTLMTPALEELLERTESKFILVSLAAMRCREITDYKLGTSIGAAIPPQVIAEESAKYLSIALEEIAAGKIEAAEVDPDAAAAEAAAASDAAELLGEHAPAAEGTRLLDVSGPGQGAADAGSAGSNGPAGA